MEFTGERYMSEVDWPDISYEHWHRYIWAAQFVPGKHVLDVACGEGYGSNYLSKVARKVVGVDIDPDIIAYASSKYPQSNLEFRCGPAQQIPYESAHDFDVVVSFETIEHLDKQAQTKFLHEVKRLLRDDGIFIVSTPNKYFYSEKANYRNEFHLHEFYEQEFIAFLQQYFDNVYTLGQKVFPTSYMWWLNGSSQQFSEHQLGYTDEHFEPAQDDQKEALFIVSVCSNRVVDSIERSILLDVSGQAVHYRTAHLADRDAQLQKNATDIAVLQGMLVERDAQLQKDTADIAALQGMLVERDAQLQKDTADIAALQGMLVERDAQLQKDAADIAALQGMLVERDAQLRKDAADIERLLSQLDQTTHQANQLRQQLADIQRSHSWQIVTAAARMRQRILPNEGRTWKLLRRTRAVWHQEGARAVIKKGVRRLRHGSSSDAEDVRPLAAAPAPEDPVDGYRRWQEEYEPDNSALRQQIEAARSLAERPLISFLTALNHPNPSMLEALIGSLRAQTYDHWELWLVASGAESDAIQGMLEHYSQIDGRVHVLMPDGITSTIEAANVCLTYISGNFVAFVGQHDLLAPFALFEVARLLNTRPQTDLLYSDHDLISPDGTQRFEPFFKPDWSPAMLLSTDYIRHLCVIRTALVRDMGSLQPESVGAEFWDLDLRIVERTNAIAHLPQVLYHVRADTANKDQAQDGALQAINRHLTRRGIDGRAHLNTKGYIHVVWPTGRHPHVSIIIPSRNLPLLRRCVESIIGCTAYPHFEFVVIDTSPGGQISAAYANHPRIRVIPYTQQFNYSTVNNLAAQHASGEILLFLNDDTEAIDSGWLEEMVRLAERDEVGIVGAKLLRADQRIQHAGVVIGLGGFANHPFSDTLGGEQTIYGDTEWYRNYSAVTGACLMIRHELFQRVGGFDEQFVLCGSDVELCLRVGEAGYQVVYTPFAQLYHLESATRGVDIPPIDFALSYVHYLSLLSNGDPYYNPNLSLWSMTPQFRKRDEADALSHVRRSLDQLGVLGLATTIMNEQINRSLA